MSVWKRMLRRREFVDLVERRDGMCWILVSRPLSSLFWEKAWTQGVENCFFDNILPPPPNQNDAGARLWNGIRPPKPASRGRTRSSNTPMFPSSPSSWSPKFVPIRWKFGLTCHCQGHDNPVVFLFTSHLAKLNKQPWVVPASVPLRFASRIILLRDWVCIWKWNFKSACALKNTHCIIISLNTPHAISMFEGALFVKNPIISSFDVFFPNS